MATDGHPPILLVSPREPSGGSWLVNCLLELGVRVDMKPATDRVWPDGSEAKTPGDLWQPASGGRFRIHPRAEELKKWLPILSRQETLAFRDGSAVLYVQDLPFTDLRGARTLLFVRDPRDAIQSMYRRLKPEMTLAEFARFPHPETLLDAIAHWRLFVLSWLARPGASVFRFEDYKTDAVATLSEILRALGLEASTKAIARAASESSFLKARAAEASYRATRPGDRQLAMRAGRVGEWNSTEELRDLAREIERRARPLLSQLGYELHESDELPTEPVGVSHLRFLSVFEKIDLPNELREAAAEADPMTCPALRGLLELASTFDASAMQRARLQVHEARSLIGSLEEVAARWHALQAERLEAARAFFADGGDYHLSRIGELVASRRRARDAAQEEAGT